MINVAGPSCRQVAGNSRLVPRTTTPCAQFSLGIELAAAGVQEESTVGGRECRWISHPNSGRHHSQAFQGKWLSCSLSGSVISRRQRVDRAPRDRFPGRAAG